jgi:hypothetical protein
MSGLIAVVTLALTLAVAVGVWADLYGRQPNNG